MLWLYRLFFLPAFLILLPTYARRMRRRGGYGENFRHRFGGHQSLPAKAKGVPRIWIQAVSVGEMLAIAPLLEGLRRAGTEVYLTTTTSTGYQLAQERYSGLTVGIGYFPIDWWWFSQRAWKRIDPDLAVLTEGERWPEHVHQAKARGKPVLCINARMSRRSFRRLQSFPPAARLVLKDLTRVLASSNDDESHFRELGIPASRITVTGNIKLDVDVPPIPEEERSRLRRELGLPETLLIVGASTWAGEEEALLQALTAARAQGGALAACSLLFVPRHAERRGELAALMGSSGWRWHLRSRGPAMGEVDVAIADTTGELRKLLQLADLVFVGKSLPPHSEGQTPVEAASLGKPILFGPGMGNFRAIARTLLQREAAVQVDDAAALQAQVIRLLGDAPARQKLAAAAAGWHGENRGAVEKTLAAIKEELARARTS